MVGEESSARVDRAFLWRSAALYALVTVFMTWPMAVSPGDLYSTRQDALLGIWNLWWVAGALFESDAQVLWTEYILYPFGVGLEVQPLSLLQSVPAAPVTLLFGPVVSFNLLALVSFWFAAWMTAVLACELCDHRPAALVAGLVFSFSPFHFTYLPELNLLPIGLVPFALWAALRYRRTPSPKSALLAGGALALVGLASWYYGIAAGLVALALSLERVWVARGALGERLRLELIYWSGCAVLLLPLAARLTVGFLGKTFLELPERAGMALDMPDFKGTAFTMSLWSYGGLLALTLALVGSLRGRRATPLVALALVSFLLSMGKSTTIGGADVALPFALLARLPFLESLRYADRFFVLTQLALALLACLGVERLALWLGRWRWMASVLYVAVGAGVLAEFRPGPLRAAPELPASAIPAAGVGDPGAVFHIPVRLRSRDGEQMFQQIQHGRPIAGGYLTRRDEALLRRLADDLHVSALIGTAPRSLPANLRQGLLAHGFAYVYVQERPLFLGTSMDPRRLRGPFSLTATEYMEQRLFPGYQNPAEVQRIGRTWITAISGVLGEPTTRDERGALFRLRRP